MLPQPVLENRPKVGIGVMILREGKVLLGKRMASHGSGEYAFPGGHLEHGESFEECARRETKEEAGIEIQNIRFLVLANLLHYKPKHYVHIGFIADWKSGEPKVMEPGKLEDWAWYDIGNLPEPLFEACAISFESYRNNKNYYDAFE